VGYGDFFPVSTMGRVVGIIVALWGMFLVSFFVVTLTNLLEFTEGELKSFKILTRLALKEDLKKTAVLVLEQAYLKMSSERKGGERVEKLVNAAREYRKRKIQFSRISK